MNKIKEYTEKVFEDIKHIDEENNEYWLARELGKILEYGEYRKFLPSIKKAMISCEKSGQNVKNHFAQMDVMVDIGSNAKRKLKDYKLTRYACYLIVQNSDSSKPVVALGQTYFAIQTRKQELTEKEYNELNEDEKRLYRRNQARKGNFNLNKTAINSGVKDLARFHNAGYKGLYNGETADDIFKRKKLRYREDILDNMGSEELADNIFRIAQTDAKLKRDNVDNKYTANSVHFEVGKEVRNSIKRLGGTMPENLPTPEKSLKELEKGNKKLWFHDIIKQEAMIMDEYLDILNPTTGEKTGEKILKKVAHKDGTWHGSIHILIVNEQRNKTLLQKRCELKDLYPNTWDIAVGGHISAGEDDITSAERELEEELGLNPKNYKLEFLGKTKECLNNNGVISNEFVSIFVVYADIDVNSITLQEEEVSEIKWCTKEELNKFIENKIIIPHEREYELLNDILK